MTWKTKRVGDTIELRNNFSEQPHYADVLIVVHRDSIVMSMNGKAVLSSIDLVQMTIAISEAQFELNEQ